MRPREDLFVIGIGHPLRRDDSVGLHLVERLKEHFGDRFHGEVAYEMDLGLTEAFGKHEHLLIIDAAVSGSIAPPFAFFPLSENKEVRSPLGFLTHIFDWGFLLALTRELHGKAPNAELLAIATQNCDMGETLSSECQQNADAAFAHLLEYCSVGKRSG